MSATNSPVCRLRPLKTYNVFTLECRLSQASQQASAWRVECTHRRVCSLSKLLQLLEGRQMAFAVHLGCFCTVRCGLGVVSGAGALSGSKMNGKIRVKQDAPNGNRLAQQVR